MTQPQRPSRLSRLLRFRPMAEGLEARALMAVAGSLDLTFGGGTGYYTAPINNLAGINGITAVAAEPDKSIIAAGPVGGIVTAPIGLIHLTASGTLDPTFGVGGIAQIPANGSINTLDNLLIQPDGKIIVVEGTSSVISATMGVTLDVARFNTNGTLDSSFGSNGQFLVHNGDAALDDASLTNGGLQPDGKIVLVGSAANSRAANPSTTQAAAIRLNANGTQDFSFGTNGLATFTGQTTAQLASTSANNEVSNGVAIQPDGKILVISTLSIPEASIHGPPLLIPTVEMFRLNADGSRDATFSLANLQSTVANGIMVQPDGKILVLGISNASLGNQGILDRYNPDGSIDKTARITQPDGTFFTPAAFGLQSDGKVVITATTTRTLGPGTSFEAVRLSTNLTPDTTFGSEGYATVSLPAPAPPTFGSNLSDAAGTLAITSDGKIILGGSNVTADSAGGMSQSQNFVARIIANGSALPEGYTENDLAVYLPTSGAFAVRPSQGGADQIILFGIPGAGQTIPVRGEFFVSGQIDIAAYLPSLGEFAIRPPSGPDQLIPFGIPGAGQTIPAPGDYFGTGRTDIAAYLPSLGAFALRNPSGGPDQIIPFGIPGPGKTIPTPGDYFGTGQTDLAVYLPSLGAFAIRNPGGGPDQIIPFGIAGTGQTIPMPGDYDGSGQTELAVYLPALGLFAYRPAHGGPDVVEKFGIPGPGQTIPAPADYTGSGHTELGVYLPALGVLAYRPPTGGDVLEAFGIPGPGQTIPVTVVDEALAMGGGSVTAASIDLLEFVPELAAKKPGTGMIVTGRS